jgi:hypothetical protein
MHYRQKEQRIPLSNRTKNPLVFLDHCLKQHREPPGLSGQLPHTEQRTLQPFWNIISNSKNNPLVCVEYHLKQSNEPLEYRLKHDKELSSLSGTLPQREKGTP